MKRYCFSILTDEWSSVELLDEENIDKAIYALHSQMIWTEFEIHSIHSEDIK